METIKNQASWILCSIAVIVCIFLSYRSQTLATILEKTELEKSALQNDMYAKANQDIQQAMRVYRSCASEFMTNIVCMDKAQKTIGEAKKLVKNDEKYYRIPDRSGTGYMDVHADAILEFMDIYVE